ncbi:hypothetical protein DSM104329_05107 [Capillimicrobium parvum]|uniref:Uncharacterized protein n=1 Tax=Capillimicrobium parvum TaxID=2884022 RepID=A0A9E6Y398_9ACTN|nr:hypothetical protein DSM104329_05107 [Capillimicrobium parvum]
MSAGALVSSPSQTLVVFGASADLARRKLAGVHTPRPLILSPRRR